MKGEPRGRWRLIPLLRSGRQCASASSVEASSAALTNSVEHEVKRATRHAEVDSCPVAHINDSKRYESSRHPDAPGPCVVVTDRHICVNGNGRPDYDPFT